MEQKAEMDPADGKDPNTPVPEDSPQGAALPIQQSTGILPIGTSGSDPAALEMQALEDARTKRAADWTTDRNPTQGEPSRMAKVHISTI